jgi:hypothetical protein
VVIVGGSARRLSEMGQFVSPNGTTPLELLPLITIQHIYPEKFKRSSDFEESNVNPCVLGRTVWRDGFSFGGSGSSRYAWKLKVPACIDCVTLGFLLDLTPVTLTATLTVPSLVLSMPSTTSRLTPPCQFATNRPHKALGWPREKPRWQRSRPQPQKAKLR